MSKRIAISGSRGLIGSSLIKSFQNDGYAITRLIRSSDETSSDPNRICWNIEKGTIDLGLLEGHDAVIHLGGANLADQRWTPSYKNTIVKSRLKSTALLAKSLAGLKQPPKVFVCASAIGYYGSFDSSVSLNESSPVGNDFLAELCEQWENAADPAREAGIRVVHVRFGVVLSREGGALKKMLPIFQLGLGGPLSRGTQMMSWIALKEVAPMIRYLIENENISGPVNAVTPNAVSNKEFTKVLADVIHRPAVFPVPGFGIRLLFGEMGDTLLLKGANVQPQRLLAAGYRFKYPDLREALEVSLKVEKEQGMRK